MTCERTERYFFNGLYTQLYKNWPKNAFSSSFPNLFNIFRICSFLINMSAICVGEHPRATNLPQPLVTVFHWWSLL